MKLRPFRYSIPPCTHIKVLCIHVSRLAFRPFHLRERRPRGSFFSKFILKKATKNLTSPRTKAAPRCSGSVYGLRGVRFVTDMLRCRKAKSRVESRQGGKLSVRRYPWVLQKGDLLTAVSLTQKHVCQSGTLSPPFADVNAVLRYGNLKFTIVVTGFDLEDLFNDFGRCRVLRNYQVVPNANLGFEPFRGKGTTSNGMFKNYLQTYEMISDTTSTKSN